MEASMSTPKRPATESPDTQSPKKRHQRILQKIPAIGDKVSCHARAVCIVKQYVDPTHPVVVVQNDRFSKNILVPIGFESQFYRNRVNWQFTVVANPQDSMRCFVITSLTPGKEVTSGPQRSVWKAYTQALETYHEQFPDEYLGKIYHPNVCETKKHRQPLFGTNARHFVGLYDKEVQKTIVSMFKI